MELIKKIYMQATQNKCDVEVTKGINFLAIASHDMYFILIARVVVYYVQRNLCRRRRPYLK